MGNEQSLFISGTGWEVCPREAPEGYRSVYRFVELGTLEQWKSIEEHVRETYFTRPSAKALVAPMMPEGVGQLALDEEIGKVQNIVGYRGQLRMSRRSLELLFYAFAGAAGAYLMRALPANMGFWRRSINSRAGRPSYWN